MPVPRVDPCAGPRLNVSYVDGALDAILGDPTVLAVLGFGDAGVTGHPDPRYFNVGLASLRAPTPFEVWRTAGAVASGRDGSIAWARTPALSFGALALAEHHQGGLAECTETAYRSVRAHLEAGPHPALLRVWHVLDAITSGDGDDERYRQFCVGRARGMAGWLDGYPAATAVGSRDGRRILRMYWISASEPGRAVENPRQLAAWRYPRQYGPQPPRFSRATLPADAALPLLLSGTASVVGHASAHADDLAAQIDETSRNLECLVDSARNLDGRLSAGLGSRSVLRAYLRDAQDHAQAAARLTARFPRTPCLFLSADVCRAELLIEIDGFHA